jgi:hypothetical protein
MAPLKNLNHELLEIELIVVWEIPRKIISWTYSASLSQLVSKNRVWVSQIQLPSTKVSLSYYQLGDQFSISLSFPVPRCN